MWGLVAKGREQQNRWLEAFQAYLEFATLAGMEEQITVPDDPSLKARGDVWEAISWASTRATHSS